MQNTSNTENEKNTSTVDLNSAEEGYDEINKKLKVVEQKMMLARENKARSGATLEGLENRKKDLISSLKNDLNLNEKNLKADEETSKYKDEIKKMEQDRSDLVTAIIKLKDSINELNQKGRERLIEAFDKAVSYTHLTLPTKRIV